jgi:hypothetical protein
LNVPRETQFNLRPGARTVRRLALPSEMLAACDRREKTVHRFVLDVDNSTVRPGSFAGLDLESGRRRTTLDAGGYLVELRARCRFESGDVRAVSVTPKIKAGDLYWVGAHDTRLARSRWTFEVAGVDVARLQDMSDDDARLEGIRNAPEPREAFRRLWAKRTRYPNYWQANPWVWVVLFNAHAGNVRKLFAGEV